MNQLRIFNHPRFGTVEIIVVDGREWFGATQSANALGYSNPHDAITRHCKPEGVAFHEVLTSGGLQQMKFINEGNLYRLITRSKLPEAESFEAYVFDEILPTIRKTGSYSIQQQLPQNYKEALIALVGQVEENERLSAEKLQLVSRIEEDKPKVQFAETCMTSDRSILVREVAKLASKQGVMIGERRLFQKLRDWGMFIQHNNEPTQRAMEMGLFEIKKGVYAHPDGARDYATPKVTVKGQMYIINRLQKEVA